MWQTAWIVLQFNCWLHLLACSKNLHLYCMDSWPAEGLVSCWLGQQHVCHTNSPLPPIRSSNYCGYMVRRSACSPSFKLIWSYKSKQFESAMVHFGIYLCNRSLVDAKLPLQSPKRNLVVSYCLKLSLKQCNSGYFCIIQSQMVDMFKINRNQDISTVSVICGNILKH